MSPVNGQRQAPMGNDSWRGMLAVLAMLALLWALWHNFLLPPQRGWKYPRPGSTDAALKLN